MLEASIFGGVKHGMSVLSHSEREAAKNALTKLKSLGSGLGSHLSGATESATVYGGAATKTGAAGLVRGHGSDTFMGGSAKTTTHALANHVNDTVVSGSSTAMGGRGWADHMGGAAHNFALSADTIDVKGTTAEGVKGSHTEQPKTGVQTVTLADKTTVTVSGLSHHDVGKVTH